MRRTKCDECGGKIVKKNVDFKLYNQSLGKFPAEVCLKCGEKCFDEETSNKIDIAAKKKGLWGLEASTKVAKAGDSLMIRINKKLVNFLDLEIGKEVHIHPENKNKIIIEID